jgi:hypothetical protein
LDSDHESLILPRHNTPSTRNVVAQKSEPNQSIIGIGDATMNV